MNRLTWLVCGIVPLMSPHTLLAQRQGRHGAGRPPTAVSNTDDLKDFKRSVALHLLQLAKDASKPDLFHSTNPLTSAVEEAQTDNEKFLQSFSVVQKSRLKDVSKKLGKVNSDVTKQSKVSLGG